MCLLQVPDVSGMVHTSDFPCLRVSEDVPDTDKRNPDIKVHTSQQLLAPTALQGMHVRSQSAVNLCALSVELHDCALRSSGSVLWPPAATSSLARNLPAAMLPVSDTAATPRPGPNLAIVPQLLVVAEGSDGARHEIVGERNMRGR